MIWEQELYKILENTRKNILVYDDCAFFPLGEVRKLIFTLKNLGRVHDGERCEMKRQLCKWQ